MVIDTSAILALVRDEPEAAHFSRLLALWPAPIISAGTMVEIGAVAVRGFGGRLDARIEHTFASIRPTVIAVSEGQSVLAREAYRRFGVGTGHPARLNFGDCFSYALAIDTGRPLLFKGDDFIHTDVRRAL